MKLQVKIFMNKIILAINSMIQNSDKIFNVSVLNNEYFFNYKGYIWGILESKKGYILTYYPAYSTVIDLINQIEYLDNVVSINYNSDGFKNQEDIESFRDLYLIVNEKVYDLDKVLDDIIENDFKFL